MIMCFVFQIVLCVAELGDGGSVVFAGYFTQHTVLEFGRLNQSRLSPVTHCWCLLLFALAYKDLNMFKVFI